MPADQDGGSLVPILKSGGAGSVQRPTEDFVWYYPHYRNMKGVFPQAAIRSGDYKLVKFYETENIHLYDLSKDLSEQTDLAEAMPERADALHARLTGYLAAVGAKIPTRNPDYDPKLDLGLEPMAPRRGPGSASRD
ncbi:MAG: DUF4976 domain-containing protein [Bryobacterales bacterium]|nr:DUF4976 domain-containing protein [Bryobacterales bacterium]